MKAHTVFRLTLTFISLLLSSGRDLRMWSEGSPRRQSGIGGAVNRRYCRARARNETRLDSWLSKKRYSRIVSRTSNWNWRHFDDRGDPKEAVTIANQIISDPSILGIVGHLNSGCSIPASQVYAKRNVLMITPASTNPKLTQQGLRNVFRLCTTDDVQGKFAADYAIDKLKIDKSGNRARQDRLWTGVGRGIQEGI